MSTITVKELAAPTGFDLKIATGETLDLKSQGTVTMPAGSVLQVVNTSTTAEQSTTATDWVDTNLSLSITPSATTSKIHIQYSFQSVYLTVANCGCAFRILRDTTSLFTPGGGYGMYNSAGVGYWQYGDIALDSPLTTSSVTYKLQVKAYNSNAVKISAGSNFKNTITLTEIAG